ncbi:glycosyl hydrolase, family 57, partial [human gut metagenome]
MPHFLALALLLNLRKDKLIMKNNPKGYVSFVLHAHLPFVHHPESEDYLEEQWLFEAISETYIPLLLNFGKL